jgi:hypothetical protein
MAPSSFHGAHCLPTLRREVDEPGAAVVRVDPPSDEASGLKSAYLSSHRGGVEMELLREAVDAARSESVQRTESQITRTINLLVQGALATERLQVSDQFQEFEFDDS